MTTSVPPPVLPDRAPTTPAPPMRGRLSLATLGVAALLIVVAGLAGALQWPAMARAPLAVAAAAAVLALAMRRFAGRGLLHMALIGLGGAVVLAMAVGLALNYLPWGLTAVSWSVGVAVVELAVLAAVATLPVAAAAVFTTETRTTARRRPPWSTLGWAAVTVAILVGAFLVADRSYTATHGEPLSLSMVRDGQTALVTVSSGTAAGPFELDLVTDTGRSALARGISVAPNSVASATVGLPAGTRGLLQLVPDGGGQPLRELILDESTPGSTSTTAATR